MRTRQSIENYLETILLLSKRNEAVRSVDIANELNFSKPSISVATKKLKALGYIDIDNSGEITLTDSGKHLALEIYERHTILSKCLIALGVDEDIAKEDACLIEHIISKESFRAVKDFYLKHKK